MYRIHEQNVQQCCGPAADAQQPIAGPRPRRLVANYDAKVPGAVASSLQTLADSLQPGGKAFGTQVLGGEGGGGGPSSTELNW